MKHVASSEKVRRNTDSMLEDASDADKLEHRLVSRVEQTLLVEQLHTLGFQTLL